MAAETFLEWAKRETAEGRYDLSAMISFVERFHAAKAREKGVDDYKGSAWWSRVRGRKSSTLPARMRDPDTGEWFVFPLFDVYREAGQPVVATIKSVACPKCGSGTYRKLVKDTKTGKELEVFACVVNGCNGGTEAWVDVTPGNTGEPLPGGEMPVEPRKDPKAEARRMAHEIAVLLEKARKVTEDHGMALPIGYRTSKQLGAMAAITGSVDEAWRIWIDGRVGRHDRAKFDEAGLPAGDPQPLEIVPDQPRWYGTAAKLVDAGLPVYLVGPAGTGKGQFVTWYAARVNKPVRVVVGSGDMAGRELYIARRDASGGTVTNVPGPITRAATRGEVAFLDEVDGFDANALLPLNSILNGDKFVSVPVLGEIRIHPETRIIAAANTNGRSKDRAYSGRNRLDGAFLNRFAAMIQTGYEGEIDRKVALAAFESALVTTDQAGPPTGVTLEEWEQQFVTPPSDLTATVTKKKAKKKASTKKPSAKKKTSSRKGR